TDAALITNATGTLSSKLRGVVALLASVINSGKVTTDSSGVTQPVSGTFFQATQPISATSLPLPANAVQETGGNLAAIAAKDFATQTTLALIKAKTDNLDAALSTRTKPADQQHVIIDSSTSIAVTGPLTDTQLRATAVPVTANAGTNLNTS